MKSETQTHLRRHGHRVLTATLLLLLAGVLALWGWNTLAVDLFGAPAAKFKHALAFEAIAGALWLVAHAVGAAGRQPIQRQA
jgi:hypothetical protein